MNSIYVTGLWRSGTSLLLRMLDGHPQLCVMPSETGIISILEKNPGMVDELRRSEAPTQLLCFLSQMPVLRFQDIIIATQRGMSFSTRRTHYSFEFDLGKFGQSFFHYLHQASSLKEIVYGYYKSIRESWINCCFPSDNEPAAFAVQRAHRRNKYPGEDPARFVMNNLDDMVVAELVRHPVWQINSALKSGEEALEEAVVAWAFAASEMAHKLKEFSGRYKVVKYEDIIEQTRNTMQGIAGFIHADMHECLMSPSFNGESWYGNSFFGKKNSLQMTSELYLADHQVNYIQKSLKQYMNDLEYNEV